MPSLSSGATIRLAGLGPHTRRHAVTLLAWHPRLTMSSGRRSVERNRKVGGSPTSFHLIGRACDFTGPDMDLAAAAETAWAMRLGAKCTGPEEVYLEFLGTQRAHLHVAW